MENPECELAGIFKESRAKQLKSLMFKSVNNIVPEYMSDKLASVNMYHPQT